MTEEMEYVLDNYPDAIKFVPDFATDKSVEIYVSAGTKKGYQDMIMMYGICFALACQKFYVETDQFEKAAAVRDAVRELNETYCTGLPTDIDDPVCEELMSMTPLEFLNSRFAKDQGIM